MRFLLPVSDLFGRTFCSSLPEPCGGWCQLVLTHGVGYVSAFCSWRTWTNFFVCIYEHHGCANVNLLKENRFFYPYSTRTALCSLSCSCTCLYCWTSELFMTRGLDHQAVETQKDYRQNQCSKFLLLTTSQILRFLKKRRAIYLDISYGYKI